MLRDEGNLVILNGVKNLILLWQSARPFAVDLYPLGYQGDKRSVVANRFAVVLLSSRISFPGKTVWQSAFCSARKT